MAKILEEMPKKQGGTGRKAIYPYDEWLDGKIRQLESEVDFKCKPQSVLTSIRTEAENRGLRLRTRYANDKKDVVIQAFTPESEDHKVEEVPPTVVQKSNKRPTTKTKVPA